MTTRDLYEVLGVPKNAGQDEIKSSYRRLAREYHPDVNPDNPEAEEKFKELGYAYNILSDPDKRARYDQFGTVEDQPQDPFFSGSASFNDIFDMFFGGMGGVRNGRVRTAQNGADVQTRVELALKDVLTATEREVAFNRLVACSTCHGTGAEGGVAPETCAQCGGSGMVVRTQQTFIGSVRTQITCSVCSGTGQIIKNPCATCRGRKQVTERTTLTVTIPPGVENGTSMRVSGRGNDGIGGGRAGDLFVGISIKADPRFERDGQELHTAIDVTYAQAALGDELSMDGVDDAIHFDVPSGTQPGDVITIRNAGLPPLHGGRRGNLYAHVRVAVPKKLNDEQRDLIVKLAQAGGEPIPQGDKSGGILGGLFKKKH